MNKTQVKLLEAVIIKGEVKAWCNSNEWREAETLVRDGFLILSNVFDARSSDTWVDKAIYDRHLVTYIRGWAKL